MRKSAIKSIIFAVLLSVNVGCQEEEPIYTATEGDYIIYGNSFGMCVGYCNRSIQITGNKISYEANGRDFEGAMPIIELSKDITIDDLANLWNKIDFNSFNHLKAVIGCPDCADGGAEWIEIKMKGSSHKTIFEYGNAPEATKAYIQQLRMLMADFNIKD